MQLPLGGCPRRRRTVSDRGPPEPLEAGGWCGQRTSGGDGSRVARPDTPAWPHHVGPPGGPQPGGGVPVAQLLALVPLGVLKVSPRPATRHGPYGPPRSRWGATLGAGAPLVAWLTPRDGPHGLDEAPCAPLPEDLAVRARRYQVPRQGVRVQTLTWVTTRVHAEPSGVEALSERSGARGGLATPGAQVNTTRGLEVLTGTTLEGGRTALRVCACTDTLGCRVMGDAARRPPVGLDRSHGSAAARWLAAARDDASRPARVVKPPRPSRDEPRVRTRRPTPSPRLKHARQALRQSLATHREMD